ncbi:MAG: squalene/phytoene synthase family protein [Pseudolabrys sp.]|nr:squalene/phytoene synthase family protein [Pseudolabrys sp.]
MIVEEAYRYCEQRVRDHDKDRFLASLYACAERRPFLFALYAFALEIGRVHRLVREPMVGTIRLQWWREALDGQRAEEAAANPVMVALQDAVRRSGLGSTPLIEAVEARQAELYGTPAVKAEAAVFVAAARLLGSPVDLAAVAQEAARAVTFACDPRHRDEAAQAYAAFRARGAEVPEPVVPAFLTVALVPLLLRRPQASQWRRQMALMRAAWFGFPRP